jgi:acyl-CoA reductase-like NAD-dependent aldehyde dehydrogenase
VEAGLIKFNEETGGVEPEAPFGGMKPSNSREQGRAAIEFFTQVKTVVVVHKLKDQPMEGESR